MLQAQRESSMGPLPGSAIKSVVTPQTDHKELMESEKPFFIPQKVYHSHGTIALLHAITNTLQRVGGAKMKSWLDDFQLMGGITKKDQEERGTFIHEDATIEKVHQKYAMKRTGSGANTTDCHHVTYVMSENKQIIELDGK